MNKKIGVYICHCGTNISSKIDIQELLKYAQSLSNVAIVRDYKFMCSDPGQNLIKQDIKKKKLDGIVVAACSPLMHELTFRNACQEAGLNPYHFQMANIREHCSWVTEEKEQALIKAKAILTSAVFKASFLESLEKRSVDIEPAVLVIGAGIAGIQASIDIAESNKKVYLVEREQSIGGHMAMFDKTFPTLDCSACILTPKMVQIDKDPNINLFNYSEVVEVKGSIGNFDVKIRKKAKSVDYQKCNGCGLCMEKCPVKVDSEFDQNLGKRRAIYTVFPQAVPNKPVIDRENCTYFKNGKCGICKKICPTGAINYEDKEQIEEIKVGAIITATGFEAMDMTLAPEYAYSKFDNVYSALEFERMSNSSGPTAGELVLKDGKKPEAVALLHCTGSRDKNHKEYCSSVCCMYLLKYAHLIKEKTDAKVYNFYIDMRCFGKGYEEFYNRLRTEGVKFIKGKVAEITDEVIDVSENGKLIIIADDSLSGTRLRVPVDMVVLSPSIVPRNDFRQVAQLLRISCGGDFFTERHAKLAPVETPTDGIFLAGMCQGPKDIPSTVAQASAAAAKVIALIDKGKMELDGIVAKIDKDLCTGCKICNDLCPYNAIDFDKDKKVSKVNEALCKACGVCVSACPCSAITGKHFTDEQIIKEIEGLLYDVNS